MQNSKANQQMLIDGVIKERESSYNSPYWIAKIKR
jgi:hypothetical protein